ncbi:unnamed protein product [Staurois parvus]|uniref:Leucine-rich repeat-containing protein 9 n=1 Tax=Staurois parvus TaxID=386267 RepID=A0ABN9FX67_9NEOB|nr:unnamed protein product [Staurois parvus]
MKKLMYYNMRVKTIKRNLREELEMLKEQKCTLEQLPRERIQLLLFQVKSLEWDLSKLQSSESHQNLLRSPEIFYHHKDQENSDLWAKGESNRTEADMEENLSQKMRALKERIHFWTSKMDDIDAFHEREVERTKKSFDLLVQFLQTELETVGNVRFEEGTPSDSWFKSCYDLILSRFCASNFKTYGISGVKINRIVRVHNRILRSKFEDRVQDYQDGEDSTANENYKKMLEYLFYTFDPSFAKKDLLHILEDGFNFIKTFKPHEQEQGIHLSNSLGFCETFTSGQARTVETNYDPEHFKHGKLIIVKVFLGRSVQAKENIAMNPDIYPDANSVFRPLKFKRNCVYPSYNETRSSEEHGSCDCSLHRCDWFVFDPELIVPEYIVEFDYIPLVEAPASSLHESAPEIKLDEHILSMEPTVKPRPKIISLDENTILSVAKVSTYSQISVLNLHGNSLSKLKEISKLRGLKKLIISFNEFSSLDDVSCLPNLEYLDASHNNVKALEGVKGLAKLKHLDVSWNHLTRIREDMNILRTQTPHLLSLNISYNPWQKPASVRMVAIGRLKSLTHLDGVLITEEEVSQSSKFFPEGRITQASLQLSARTDHVKPRCLSLLPSAQILSLK